jgi:hypothetical protein
LFFSECQSSSHSRARQARPAVEDGVCRRIAIRVLFTCSADPHRRQMSRTTTAKTPVPHVRRRASSRERVKSPVISVDCNKTSRWTDVLSRCTCLSS